LANRATYGAIYGMWTRAQWVVNQGLEGVHHLFEPFIVREAMTTREFGDDTVESVIARQVEDLLSHLETERSISRQRDRIADAPLEVQQTLVRLYFSMLFRVLEERSQTLH
jgi:hypothetical protein